MRCAGTRFGVAELMERSYTDPETLRLADKVTCEIDPDVQAVFPKKRGAKVRIELKDGTVYEKELYDLKGLARATLSASGS